MIKILLLGVSLSAAFSSGCQTASAEDFHAKNEKASIRAVPANTPQALAQMTARLENLSPDEFQPRRHYFEEIISTLKIENPEK